MVIADIDDDRGERIAAEFGHRCRYVHANVSQDGAADAAVAAATAEFGGLDCLVNNAGNPGSTGDRGDRPGGVRPDRGRPPARGVPGHPGSGPGHAPAGPGQHHQHRHVAGLAAGWGGHDHSASKAAIIQLTRTAASELGEDGVRVNAICPGAIATPIFGRAAGLDPGQAQLTTEFMTAALGDLAPIRRAGQPADIAEAARWLASDASGYVNGQAIAVDGGLLTGPLHRQQKPALLGLLELLRQSPPPASSP